MPNGSGRSSDFSPPFESVAHKTLATFVNLVLLRCHRFTSLTSGNISMKAIAKNAIKKSFGLMGLELRRKGPQKEQWEMEDGSLVVPKKIGRASCRERVERGGRTVGRKDGGKRVVYQLQLL